MGIRENLISYGYKDISRTKGNYDSSDTIDDVVLLCPEIFNDGHYRIRLVALIRKDVLIIKQRWYHKVGQEITPKGFWRYIGSESCYKGRVSSSTFLFILLKNIYDAL